MKKKYLILLSLVLALACLLMACTNENQSAKETPAEEPKKVSSQSVLQKEIQKAEENKLKWNTKKDLKVAAGTRDIAEVLNEIAYDNVVAVPEDALDLFPEAKSIGDYKNPDLSDLTYDDIDLIISESTKNFLIDAMNESGKQFEILLVDLENEDNRDGGLVAIGRILGLEDVTKVAYNIEK
ncbi:hypothetical protein [Neofamilia massiliensis]|uniref:hypothetical protein n=1 Tax=Neofamilia massiliensis TaxID=1673724 RepID=UPI0006BB63FA|nr:hypothetical protein [Neofamilia massiliensis]